MAEMVGFEPTCHFTDKTISSRSRYDHFDTSPYEAPQFQGTYSIYHIKSDLSNPFSVSVVLHIFIK